MILVQNDTLAIYHTTMSKETSMEKCPARQVWGSVVSRDILAQPTVAGDMFHPELSKMVESNSWSVGDY